MADLFIRKGFYRLILPIEYPPFIIYAFLYSKKVDKKD